MMAVKNINQIRTCRHMWNQAFLCSESIFWWWWQDISVMCVQIYLFFPLLLWAVSILCWRWQKRSQNKADYVALHFSTRFSFFYLSHILNVFVHVVRSKWRTLETLINILSHSFHPTLTSLISNHFFKKWKSLQK